MRGFLSLRQPGLQVLLNVQRHQLLGKAAATATAAVAARVPGCSCWWHARLRHENAARDHSQERNQQLVDELYAAHGHLGFSRNFFMKITTRRGVRVTPQQFGERFSMLQRVTGAQDPKQQAALVRSLRVYPKTLSLLPDKVQFKTIALKQQLQQQLSVDPERTQQLISKCPKVLEFLAGSLVQKAKEQGQLLELEAADVVTQLWMRTGELLKASTQLLHEKVAQLQQLLQPYMSPADVRQLVLSQPGLMASHSADAVRMRLAALEECLPGWSPQQLGAALLTYPSVLNFSPDSIRYKWRVLSQYRDMYMLGNCKQEEQRQQQQQQQRQQQDQQQPHQASELGIFIKTKERYAMLEYIMEQQQQHGRAGKAYSGHPANSTSSRDSNSNAVASSSKQVDLQAPYMPPAITVLGMTAKRFTQLVLEHYPGFWLWYKQQQQEEKQAKQ